MYVHVKVKSATQSTAARHAVCFLAGKDLTAMKISMNVRTPRRTVVRTRTARTRTDHSFVSVTVGTPDCPTDVTVSVLNARVCSVWPKISY